MDNLQTQNSNLIISIIYSNLFFIAKFE